MLQKKQQSAKYNTKSNAQNNVKSCAKRALNLLETKRTKNDMLVAQGIGIDAALEPYEIETIALEVVETIKTIVQDGKVYVFTSAKRRIEKESFASVTVRGNGTCLISYENGDNVTATDMKETFNWVCVKSLYESTSAYNNMNEVEKQVHQLLFENDSDSGM